MTHTIAIYQLQKTESISGDKEIDHVIKISEAFPRLLGKHEFEIHLIKYDTKQKIFSASELEGQLKGLSSKPEFLNYAGATREIDGTVGAIASFDYNVILYSMPAYMVIYYPNCDPNHLKCLILSSYPWNEGTLQLLKTIHVEKA